jgi:hypothetical protein
MTIFTLEKLFFSVKIKNSTSECAVCTGVESDLPPPVNRGPTDEFGRPINKYDNGYPKRPLSERKLMVCIVFCLYNRIMLLRNIVPYNLLL